MTNKIILVSNAYWPSIGGIENSLRHLAFEAEANGDEVVIVAGDIGLSQDDPLRFRALVDGIEVHRYPVTPFHFTLLKPLNLLVSNWRQYQILKRMQRSNPQAIIIARFHFCALMAILAGFERVKYVVPSIVANQCRSESQKRGWSARVLLTAKIWVHSAVQRMVLGRAENFVFSKTMLNQCQALMRQSPASYKLTKPGVDGRRFFAASSSERRSARVELGLPVDLPLILFVGRFVRAKGVELLLDSVARIEQECHLIVVGSGERRARYEKQIAALGLADKVTLLQAKMNVEEYYRCADLFVMSSSYEPLGQTLLEAFASGLSVVAFRRSATVDTATEELGMDSFISYASKHDADSLAAAILEQLGKLKDNDRDVISRLTLERFNWGRLYQELIR